MILSYVRVLRVHALAVRRGLERYVRPPLVRDALRLARALVPVIRATREDAEGPFPSEGLGDEPAAILVAFAAMWRAFGSGHAAVVMVNALVDAQVARRGLCLRMEEDHLTSLTIGAMYAADDRRSIDYAGISTALASAIRPPRTTVTNPRRRPSLRHGATRKGPQRRATRTRYAR